MKSKILFFLLIALFASCSSDYSPKPKGYFRIELPEPVYHDFNDFQFFTFSFSNQARVEVLDNVLAGIKEKDNLWFNLNYPHLNAQIYCSFLQINKSDFPALMEESHQMVYVREIRAKGVKETEYSDDEQKVYGLIYELQGDAASPIHFVISDSTSSFFRGALYFETHFNRDSIAPVLEYINNDIKVMIESFKWKQ